MNHDEIAPCFIDDSERTPEDIVSARLAMLAAMILASPFLAVFALQLSVRRLLQRETKRAGR